MDFATCGKRHELVTRSNGWIAAYDPDLVAAVVVVAAAAKHPPASARPGELNQKEQAT